MSELQKFRSQCSSVLYWFICLAQIDCAVHPWQKVFTNWPFSKKRPFIVDLVEEIACYCWKQGKYWTREAPSEVQLSENHGLGSILANKLKNNVQNLKKTAKKSKYLFILKNYESESVGSHIKYHSHHGDNLGNFNCGPPHLTSDRLDRNLFSSYPCWGNQFTFPCFVIKV